jgi:L-fucose isomerase-like protein
VATEPESAVTLARSRIQALRETLTDVAEFVPEIVGDGDLLADVTARVPEVDVVLVQLSTVLDAAIWSLDAPIIAWSGERTPMMGLYNLPLALRRENPNISLCLDEQDLRDALVRVRARQVTRRLCESRMIALGAYQSADRVPDPEKLREKLGVELVQVPAADFLSLVDSVDGDEAAERGAAWLKGATRVDEPDEEDVASAARIHVALERLMERERAQAVSVGCLEIMYAHARRPFCWVLASLRDVGLPAGCEADAAATLTLLMVEYLAERPGYMGNLVDADPDGGTVAISHGCSPTRMFGRDGPAHEYRLVHSHSAPPFSRDLTDGSGLTSYVEYTRGQRVTVARLGGDLDTLLVTAGEIVDCRDTICDRTTVTVSVADPRRFVQLATGNHQCLFYGDLVAELTEVGRQLGLDVVNPANPPD